MRIQGLLCLALSTVTAAMAQSSGFLLGVKYSEILDGYTAEIATDGSGAIYLLEPGCVTNVSDCVTKVSADGTTILWRNQLGFQVNAMIVDPNGGVYAIPAHQPGDTTSYVAKLGAGGTGIAWKTPVGFVYGFAGPALFAADSQGRAYVAAATDWTNGVASVVRLNAAGTAIDYAAPLTGIPTALAVDSSGAAYVAGYAGAGSAAAGFLAQVAPDGGAGFLATLPGNSDPEALAMDASGNAVVLGGNGALQRVDPTGAVTNLATVPSAYGGVMALDAAGNAYVVSTGFQAFQIRNSIATCGNAPADFEFLTVIAPDGSLLQTTYLQGSVGAVNPQIPALATGPNSNVFILATAGPNYAPTQAGPFTPAKNPASTFLLRLAPNPNAPVTSLACLGNGASFRPGPISPGEIVSLFGSGLGPEQGVQTQATLQSPYPTQAAGVEVTFDGKPAPLLWVQDQQINVVVPWSLTPGENTQICVSYDGVNTNCLNWAVVQTAPAVFTTDGTYAAAINQDGSINSAANPAPVGSIVSVWATGLGPITPAQADGTLVGFPLPTNVLTPFVFAPNSFTPNCSIVCVLQPFDVEYAGPAPGLVAGITQINFHAIDYPGEINLSQPPNTISPKFEVYVAGQ
jgi:uncharacterized protein (TIGR03437 family)